MEEKAQSNKEPINEINMNLSPEDVAKFIIGTYGYEFASFIADEIKNETEVGKENMVVFNNLCQHRVIPKIVS